MHLEDLQKALWLFQVFGLWFSVEFVISIYVYNV